MRIKNFVQFINEEISGTEIPQKTQGSYFGPAYGDTVSPNTINKSHTDVRQVSGHQNPDSNNNLTSDLFFEDDYKNTYHRFLQAGGSQTDLSGDRDTDLPIMLDFLNER
jgi:hypothetical protein